MDIDRSLRTLTRVTFQHISLMDRGVRKLRGPRNIDYTKLIPQNIFPHSESIATDLSLDHLSLRQSGFNSFWFRNLGRSSFINLLRYGGFCIEASACTRATKFESSSSSSSDSSLSRRTKSKDRVITLPLGLWVCLFFCFCFFEFGELGAHFLFFSLACFGASGWERVSFLVGGLNSTSFPRPTKEKG